MTTTHETASSPDVARPQSPKDLQLPDRVPEILAPAGGRAQFFAALHAGADAVYLGMKEFNARSRAENFTLDDLRELVPLAHAHGMQVLVTLNIILKEAELPQLLHDLIQLEWIGVDAVIVQDLGVARLIRTRFPGLRLHASTQLAVHNLHGVRKARELGFKRVVLARELTAQELRLIRQEIPRTEVEIEAFCHGSLCYSYSGLCFFSGAADARSGNRGECAYTCRKPYKVLNEPGHGFLFSMKDLDTSKDIEKLIHAGVDTLKIEGRKKDAQYVATVVGLYRQQLDRAFGRSTAPRNRKIERDFRNDMAFSYHRETTSFFVKGRYHENVIDLDNPTHKGRLIGTIKSVKDQTVELVTKEALERFDGLRVDSDSPVYHARPQHGDLQRSSTKDAQRKYANEVCQFSLRDFSVKGRRTQVAEAGQTVAIEIPEGHKVPKVGDRVYKVRSNELKRHTEKISQVPADHRLLRLSTIDLRIESRPQPDGVMLEFSATLAAQPVVQCQVPLSAERPRRASTFKEDLHEALQILGELGMSCSLDFVGDFEWFVPRKLIKQCKNQLIDALREAVAAWDERKADEALRQLQGDRECLPAATPESCRYQIKCDRPEHIDAVLAAFEKHEKTLLAEIIFEPKRAFLGQVKPAEVLAEILRKLAPRGVKFRLALPTVLRAWDEPLLKPWLMAMRSLSLSAFEVGNVGAVSLLEKFGFAPRDCDLASDFTLYALNTEAVRQLGELGCQRVALSVEDDRDSIKDKLKHWPKSGPKPQAILYKDTPLFIAEACSLTALHQGCPTAKVCGYRTLQIENDEGERFFVAHESCKSIVYGADAFGISQFAKELQASGVEDFRVDFLTRPYTPEDIANVLGACLQQKTVAGTHSANYGRHLL